MNNVVFAIFDTIGYDYEKSLWNNSDRDYVLEQIKKDGTLLKYVKKEFKNDEEIVLAAIKQNPSAIKYANARFRKEKDLFLKIVSANGLAYIHNKKFKDDEDIIEAAVRQNGEVIKYVKKVDKNLALIAITQNAKAFEYLPSEIKSDEDFILDAISETPGIIEYLPKSKRENPKFILNALSINEEIAYYISERLLLNREIMQKIIETIAFFPDKRFMKKIENFENKKQILRIMREIMIRTIDEEAKQFKIATPQIEQNQEGQVRPSRKKL